MQTYTKKTHHHGTRIWLGWGPLCQVLVSLSVNWWPNGRIAHKVPRVYQKSHSTRPFTNCQKDIQKDCPTFLSYGFSPIKKTTSLSKERIWKKMRYLLITVSIWEVLFKCSTTGTCLRLIFPFPFRKEISMTHTLCSTRGRGPTGNSVIFNRTVCVEGE